MRRSEWKAPLLPIELTLPLPARDAAAFGDHPIAGARSPCRRLGESAASRGSASTSRRKREAIVHGPAEILLVRDWKWAPALLYY